MRAYTCLLALLKFVSYLGGTGCTKVLSLQRSCSLRMTSIYITSKAAMVVTLVTVVLESSDKRGGLDEASHAARGEMGVGEFRDTDHCYHQPVFTVTP